jgi:hypothetical protein
MQTTHRAHASLAPRPGLRPGTPPHERDARDEIDRLRAQIEVLVDIDQNPYARHAVDAALGAATRLQVVTANLDACRPPSANHYGRPLVALADLRLRGASDAIERGMAYTADNQMRLLQTERATATE